MKQKYVTFADRSVFVGKTVVRYAVIYVGDLGLIVIIIKENSINLIL
jgi:hypothetical protein